MDQETLETVRDKLDQDFGIVQKVGATVATAKFLRNHPWTMIVGGGALLGLGTYFSRKDKKAKKEIKAEIKSKEAKKDKKAKKRKEKELEA